MKLTHLLLLVHPMMAHLIHGSHLVHRVHRMHGIHLTHVVHLMHGVHLIHLMHMIHGIHAAASRERRHTSLYHVALISHAITPVHAQAASWAHVHLRVGVVHTQALGPHGTTLVSTITIMLP